MDRNGVIRGSRDLVKILEYVYMSQSMQSSKWRYVDVVWHGLLDENRDVEIYLVKPYLQHCEATL